MRLIILSFALLGLICISCGEQIASTAKKETVSTKGQQSNVQDAVISPKATAIKKDTLAKIETITISEPLHSKKPEEHTTPSLASNSDHKVYNWMDTYAIDKSLAKQISTPDGYQRISLEKTSFGAWLRGLPLLHKEAKVLLYNGQVKPYQEGAYRVLDIDIGRRDLQQCADAIMRLVAEYHYSKKDYAAIHFNYTSGHTIRFSDWSRGKKPVIKGSKVSFSASDNRNNTSYKNFKKYLTNVYCYAGTASLSKELASKKVSDILPGDIFIWGSFPGHAVMVMDVAVHQETGKKIFLLAQSYMPAQSIHVLRNFNNKSLSPWYSEDFGAELLTPEWTFDRNTLKTFDID